MKSDLTQERIRKVLMGVLLPLARTLLRCGVGYTEFAELSKRAFVEAASADYGVRNRPTNIARVAVMTGLSRKEVSRVRRECKKRRSTASASVTIPAAVLNEWHTNPRYFERKSGEPRVLAYSGRGYTFSSLVARVTRDIPAGAMCRELVRAGAIQMIGGKKVVPLKRHFIPDTAGEKIIVGLELGLRRLAETVAVNSNPGRPGERRFQRFVESSPIELKYFEQLRPLVHEKLLSVSEEIDDLLSLQTKALRRKDPSLVSTDALGRIGVGIYYHEEKSQ
ncbi:MAG: hypothetical protein KJ054_01585 [Gammaproteobacteria bacterium]|nr:hypothetical protein [Gammaproteobacteria bacterium]